MAPPAPGWPSLGSTITRRDDGLWEAEAPGGARSTHRRFESACSAAGWWAALPAIIRPGRLHYQPPPQYSGAKPGHPWRIDRLGADLPPVSCTEPVAALQIVAELIRLGAEVEVTPAAALALAPFGIDGLSGPPMRLAAVASALRVLRRGAVPDWDTYTPPQSRFDRDCSAEELIHGYR